MRCTSFFAVESTLVVLIAGTNVSMAVIQVKAFVNSAIRFSVEGERFTSHPRYPQPHRRDLKLGQYPLLRIIVIAFPLW